MPKYPLVEEAAEHCWSKNFMDTFRQFFADNADKFINAPKLIQGEQNLEYYAVYQKYLKLYESTLLDYIENLGATVPEFYKELEAIQNDKNIKNKKLLHFVNYLAASVDYESFYKVMVRTAKKVNTEELDEHISPNKLIIDAEADVKASSSVASDSKNSDSKSSHSDAKESSAQEKKFEYK